MLKKFYVLSDQAVLICEVKPLSKSKKLHFFWTFSNSGWLSGGYDVPGAQLQKVFLPPGTDFLRRNFPNIEEEFS